MMDDYFSNLKQYQNGIDSFKFWVKSYKDRSSYKRVSIVINYYLAGGYDKQKKQVNTQKPGKQSELTFIRLCEKFLEKPKEDVAIKIKEKEELRLKLLSLYSKVSSLNRGFDGFYEEINSNTNGKYKEYTQQYVVKWMLQSEVVKKLYPDKYIEIFNDFTDHLESYVLAISEGEQEFYIKNIPEKLVVPLQQYLLFFRDFVRDFKNDNVDFNILTTKSGLIFKFASKDMEELDKVKGYLNEYVQIAKKALLDEVKPEEITSNFRGRDIDKLRLENQISTLQMNIKLVETVDLCFLRQSIIVK